MHINICDIYGMSAHHRSADKLKHLFLKGRLLSLKERIWSQHQPPSPRSLWAFSSMQKMCKERLGTEARNNLGAVELLGKEKTLHYLSDLRGTGEGEKPLPTVRDFKSAEGSQAVCRWHSNALPCPRPPNTESSSAAAGNSLVFLRLWESGGEGPVPHLVQLGQPGETEQCSRPQGRQCTGATCAPWESRGQDLEWGILVDTLQLLADQLASWYTDYVFIFQKTGAVITYSFVSWFFVVAFNLSEHEHWPMPLDILRKPWFVIPAENSTVCTHKNLPTYAPTAGALKWFPSFALINNAVMTSMYTAPSIQLWSFC